MPLCQQSDGVCWWLMWPCVRHLPLKQQWERCFAGLCLCPPQGTSMLAQYGQHDLEALFLYSSATPGRVNPPWDTHSCCRCPEAVAGGTAGPHPHCCGCWHWLHPGVPAPEPWSAGNTAFGPVHRCANEGEWPAIANAPPACPERCVRPSTRSAEALTGGRGPGACRGVPSRAGWCPRRPVGSLGPKRGRAAALPSALCLASQVVKDTELSHRWIRQFHTPDKSVNPS